MSSARFAYTDLQQAALVIWLASIPTPYRGSSPDGAAHRPFVWLARAAAMLPFSTAKTKAAPRPAGPRMVCAFDLLWRICPWRMRPCCCLLLFEKADYRPLDEDPPPTPSHRISILKFSERGANPLQSQRRLVYWPAAVGTRGTIMIALVVLAVFVV